MIYLYQARQTKWFTYVLQCECVIVFLWFYSHHWTWGYETYLVWQKSVVLFKVYNLYVQCSNIGIQISCTSSFCLIFVFIITWYSGKLPFECKKNLKSWKFFQKNCQKLSVAINKKDNFCNLKKSQVFGNFLTFKWQ